jgi:hypothetical protein
LRPGVLAALDEYVGELVAEAVAEAGAELVPLLARRRLFDLAVDPLDAWDIERVAVMEGDVAAG